MASCHGHARPQHMRLLSAKTGSQLATRQRYEPVSSSRYSLRSVGLTTHPRFRPGVIIEKPRSYSLCDLSESLLPCRCVPPHRPQESISHHLDNLSRSQGTPLAHYKHRRPGWSGFQEGEPGEVPSLLNRRVQLAASTILQALQALNGTTAFSTAPGLGAGTGLSSQPGSKLTRSYPWSLSRSAGWSGTLVPSSRGTPRGVRLRSHPVEHTSCNSLHAVEGTHTP